MKRFLKLIKKKIFKPKVYEWKYAQYKIYMILVTLNLLNDLINQTFINEKDFHRLFYNVPLTRNGI